MYLRSRCDLPITLLLIVSYDSLGISSFRGVELGSRGDRDREGRAGWLLRGSLRSCEGGEVGVALNWLHLEGLVLTIEGYSLGSHGWLD